jgi:phosphoenolpyruvate carboxykinase (GTP)
MPNYSDLHWSGLDFPKAKFDEIMKVYKDAAMAEAEDQTVLFEKFGDSLPKELELHRQMLIARLERTADVWELIEHSDDAA